MVNNRTATYWHFVHVLAFRARVTILCDSVDSDSVGLEESDWNQWCWHLYESTKSKWLCRWLGPAHQLGYSFCSYIILDNAQHIARSSVISIPQYEFLFNHNKEETKKFMTSLESIIGYYIKDVFQPTSPYLVYHDYFGEISNTDDNFLPYGDELVNAKY